MNKLIAGVAGLAFATTMALTPAASAVVDYAPATGGFVGKGDVQLVFGWNNAQLQRNAEIVKDQFTYVGTTVQETTWICTKDNGNTQERERVTTTTTSGVAASVLRDNKRQVTGFLMDPISNSTSMSETEGPRAGSCPTNWVASNLVVGDEVSLGGTLYVDGRALT